MTRSLAFKSASELTAMLRSGSVSSTELVSLHLERIAKFRGLNALITINSHAKEIAAELDAELKNGQTRGPLHGLPITIKDAWATSGLRTTSGQSHQANWVPSENAPVVQRLVDAGAVILGKSNVPPGITGQETFNALAGRAINPRDPSRTPGGSSGGASAAICAGLSALDVGSDAGGSIRQPAHCTGIFGHVATRGTIPVRGHLPSVGLEAVGKHPDLLGVGPMARSAADLELAMQVLAGPDAITGSHLRVEFPEEKRERLEEFRVGAWLDDEDLQTEPEVLEVLKSFVGKLQKAGCKVDTRAHPGFQLGDARALAFSLWVAMGSYKTPSDKLKTLEKFLHADHDQASGLPLARLRARAELLRHGSWLHLDDARANYASVFADYFEDHDFLLCPVSPCIAPKHDMQGPVESLDRRLELTLPSSLERGHPRPYLDQISWSSIINMCGLASTVVPAGFEGKSGMPVGIQVVGKWGSDLGTIGFAKLVEKEVGGFVVPDGFDD